MKRLLSLLLGALTLCCLTACAAPASVPSEPSDGARQESAGQAFGGQSEGNEASATSEPEALPDTEPESAASGGAEGPSEPGAASEGGASAEAAFGNGAADEDGSSSGSGTASGDEQTARRLRLTVDGQEVLLTLYDTPTADALYEALPMELTFTDFNGTEKIAYPPETLPAEGEPDGCDPGTGDLCLYAPWGNLSVFYKDYRYSQSLIKLGHVEAGLELLSGMDGDFTATLERVE